MAEVSAAQVKELREKTGVGMMDCKKALAETQGDLEAAVDWLRAKGLSKAAKKADRAAAEGLVGVTVRGGLAGAIVELNSETDFVARNEQFQKTARAFGVLALDLDGDLERILAAPAPDGDGKVSDMITRLIATIGENIHLRRAGALKVESGAVVSYVHNAVADGLGRIGVLVALSSTGQKAAVEEVGRKIALHIAAAAPIALSIAEIPAEAVARERAIFAEQARASGKSENVIEKMIEGRLRKFYEEVVLTKQAFVMNPDQTVEAAVKEAEKAAGAPIALVGFRRFQLGDGVEKRANDFAAEVAATAGRV
jgi:elongation factor Ts